MRLPRLTLFWRIQLTAWSVFAACTFSLKLAAFGSIPFAVALTLVREPLGFVLSSLLRQLYLPLQRRGIAPLRLGLVVIAACAAAGVFDAFLGRWISTALGHPEATLTTVGIFCIRSFTYFAWSLIYFWAKEQRAAQHRALTLARAETARREAELQLLRAQVNPHFLFNALNTILATLEPDQARPRRVAEGLAAYLRYSLSHRHDSTVPLGTEYDAALHYLAVEQERFRGELLVDAIIDDEARDIPVPGVLIQPLIENAVKYSRHTSEPPYRVRLRVTTPRPGEARIEVANTGTWVEPSQTPGPHGTGLANIRRRLELLYPERHELAMSETAGWVTAKLRIADGPSRIAPTPTAAISAATG
jgi:hypothetical protein